MTVEEYFDHLLKIGMGWLGWTEDQTLDTSMPAIALAYEGRLEMLQSIFGSGEAASAEPEEADPDIANRLKNTFRALANKPKGGMR